MTMLETTGVRDAAGSRLRRELGRFDTVFFLISAMVAVDTIGAIAIGGGEVFTWLVVLFATFFIPSALVTAELGAALPVEGGLYVWVRLAFGRFAGTLTSMLYWAGTPLWIGGSVAVVAHVGRRAVLRRPVARRSLLFGAAFVALATAGAVIPLRIGKWLPTSGAIGQIVLLSFFTATVAAYGVEHGFRGIAVGDLTPTHGVFIAVVPVLLYSFVGVELPSTAGEEMRDPRRDIPVAIAHAGVAQALMYGVPILAVLLVLPAEAVTSLHGLIDALQTSLTVYGGSVDPGGAVHLSGLAVVIGWCVAALFVWVLVASASAWIMGGGRAQAAACRDGGGPAFLGAISARTGVPVTMGLVTGVSSLLAMAAALAVVGDDAQKYLSAALTVSITLVVLAYLLIFPAFLALRLRRPDLQRPFVAPGGRLGAWVVTALSAGWSLVAAVCLLWPGLGTARPDASLAAGLRASAGAVRAAHRRTARRRTGRLRRLAPGQSPVAPSIASRSRSA